MKIASLVPSWTETLLASGANVVGRTRFCIHPQSGVTSIPAIGGTKDVDFARLASCGAELLVLDREENPKSIADQSPIPYVDTHVVSVETVAPALRRIAFALSGDVNSMVRAALESRAQRWERVVENAARAKLQGAPSWSDLPGVIEWLRLPKRFERPLEGGDCFLYLIWKNPWMAASPQTFIGSVLGSLGFAPFHAASADKYPQVDLDSFDPEKTVLLFSSEPFPFARRRAEILQLPFPCALVDGESFSWFGDRSLAFLEAQTES